MTQKNQKTKIFQLKESFYKIQEVGNEINKKLFEKKIYKCINQ